jgi:hypothetical protein
MLVKSVEDTATIGDGSIPVNVNVYPLRSAAAVPLPPVPEAKSSPLVTPIAQYCGVASLVSTIATTLFLQSSLYLVSLSNV